MSESDIIFNRKKVKYASLNELLPVTSLANKDEINVIIDSRSLFDFFYIDFYKNMIPNLISSSNEVLASFYNYIAHYNNFFNNLGIYKINYFIIYNSKEDEIRNSYDPEFWDKKNSKGTKLSFITFLLNKAKEISKYFRNISVIDGQGIDNHFIPAVLCFKKAINTNKFTFIISEDEFFVQYSLLFKNFYNIRASTSDGKIIKKNEFFKYVYERSSYKLKPNQEIPEDDSLISMFLAVSGYEDLESIGKYKRKKTIDAFEKVKCNHEEFFNLFSEEEKEEILDRLEYMDIMNVANKISEDHAISIVAQINKNDKLYRTALNNLNSTHFNGKINLNWLV